MNKAAPLICIPFGLYWIVMGSTKYHLWISDGPGGGLFPVVAGILLVGCGGVLLRRAIKAKVKVPVDRRAFQFIAAAFLTALSMYLVGMIPAVGIFVLCWLKFFEKQAITKSVVISIGTALFLFVIFGVLLKVPLPMGLLGKI